ncbi:unnamed protein product [Bursaphelenchus xylophilus]|uniref:(pine wood nematode) hypothetical protein n=1 Tax=Bursaphelenchus xylophilus TaxID=6326 RepID=A0A1I7SVX6_BURXY|nr:unnamed protein product [Bursaphelenchus xylophilus]CAG9098454.1 unnamed protein product [Bursaphelenchus xylophilus]
MIELNEQQKRILGSWVLESGNGPEFDRYLQEIGIPAFARMIANSTFPKFYVTLEGEEWTVKMESSFKSDQWKFKLGQKFTQRTVDGREFWCVVELTEDGKIIETQSNAEGSTNVPSTITRWVDDEGKMHAQSKANDIQCERIFVRI